MYPAKRVLCLYVPWWPLPPENLESFISLRGAGKGAEPCTGHGRDFNPAQWLVCLASQLFPSAFFRCSRIFSFSVTPFLPFPCSRSGRETTEPDPVTWSYNPPGSDSLVKPHKPKLGLKLWRLLDPNARGNPWLKADG